MRILHTQVGGVVWWLMMCVSFDVAHRVFLWSAGLTWPDLRWYVSLSRVGSGRVRLVRAGSGHVIAMHGANAHTLLFVPVTEGMGP